MKITFLNIWGGTIYEPLMAFLREQAPTTDFFCLQEVFDSPESRTVSWRGHTNTLALLRNILPAFAYFYAPVQEGHDGNVPLDFPVSQGIALFVRKDIAPDAVGDIVIHGEKNGMAPSDLTSYPCNLQYIRFQHGQRGYTLAHVHGTAHPGSKRDTPERIAQSQKVIDFLARKKGEKILGGDFNLLPDTESIHMIERMGMRNLITEYGITTTRNAFSYGQYSEHDRQYFADYAFVSPGVPVQSFVVPHIEVSDHLPLILEFA